MRDSLILSVVTKIPNKLIRVYNVHAAQCVKKELKKCLRTITITAQFKLPTVYFSFSVTNNFTLNKFDSGMVSFFFFLLCCCHINAPLTIACQIFFQPPFQQQKVLLFMIIFTCFFFSTSTE